MTNLDKLICEAAAEAGDFIHLRLSPVACCKLVGLLAIGLAQQKPSEPDEFLRFAKEIRERLPPAMSQLADCYISTAEMLNAQERL
jgi:hypothetical protein